MRYHTLIAISYQFRMISCNIAWNATLMTEAHLTSPDDIRSAFSAAMSAMYRDEVPAYGTLMELIRR